MNMTLTEAIRILADECARLDELKRTGRVGFFLVDAESKRHEALGLVLQAVAAYRNLHE